VGVRGTGTGGQWPLEGLTHLVGQVALLEEKVNELTEEKADLYKQQAGMRTAPTVHDCSPPRTTVTKILLVATCDGGVGVPVASM
jgi:Mrp family chromosome partitioning ATPase